MFLIRFCLAIHSKEEDVYLAKTHHNINKCRFKKIHYLKIHIGYGPYQIAAWNKIIDRTIEDHGDESFWKGPPTTKG